MSLLAKRSGPDFRWLDRCHVAGAWWAWRRPSALLNPSSSASDFLSLSSSFPPPPIKPCTEHAHYVSACLFPFPSSSSSAPFFCRTPRRLARQSTIHGPCHAPVSNPGPAAKMGSPASFLFMPCYSLSPQCWHLCRPGAFWAALGAVLPQPWRGLLSGFLFVGRGWANSGYPRSFSLPLGEHFAGSGLRRIWDAGTRIFNA